MFVLSTEGFREARITFILITINIVSFISINFALEPSIFLLLVQDNDRIINYYEFWRLISAMFLHNDILHIFSNMFALLIFGTFIESNFSRIAYIGLYLISGLIGNLFSLILLPLNTISLGASGCIFGLIGAALAFIIKQKNRILLILSGIYIVYFIISSFSPGINFYAHIFGLLGGFFFSLFLKKKKKVDQY
ncbi:MAG: rhomboid family intramembrane serine protease [Candidatus Heimdallarchaeota archaeon]